jgi:hypothetical protein
MQEMMLGALVAVGLILTGSPGPSAQVTAIQPATSPGNLAADFYAQPGCVKPDKPTLPKPNYDDRAGVAQYNQAVRRYNDGSKAFDACINAYVDKAPNDIDWIMFTVNTAVAKANGSNPPSAPTATGNMASGFYPSPDCIAPDRALGAIPNGRDTDAMEARNTRVRTFNVLAGGFNDCIKAYVAKAQTDIERVEQAQKDAALKASGQ